MTKKDRERSYRVTTLEELLRTEGLPGRGTYRWFPALVKFMNALDVDVMYLPANEIAPGLVWFMSSDSGVNEAFVGLRIKGTKNRTATGATFENAARTCLKSFSGYVTRISRDGVTAPGPGGCMRTTFYVDEYRIPEFSSPEELFFRMSVAGIGKDVTR